LPNSVIWAAYIANNVQLNPEIETKIKKPACFIKTKGVLSHPNETLDQIYIEGEENILIYDCKMD
jgi:hypothetical protein